MSTPSYRIVAYTNRGAAEICHNMVESLARFGHRPEIHGDQEALAYLSKVSAVDLADLVPCQVAQPGYSNYGTAEFNHVTAGKIYLLAGLLTHGRDVVYVDTDVFFLRDPHADIVECLSQPECFHFEDDSYGGGGFGSGFMVIKRSAQSARIACEWSCALDDCHGTKDDQAVLNSGVLGQFPCRLLSPRFVRNGHGYFKEGIRHDNQVAVHANYFCGMDAKVKVLKDHGMWLVG